ncbi:50S ribosomal protein L2 [Candidatus Johnevansia muelleri]|uniref:Large ribosomal subunit protein uL2 n=1 Tax=Candidatus Johnevansia muelleri TaxID=1495769 RepID=A0A078KHF6_9GAMM|nr:50S ribosomal protein L2 [Candidatus Evansia muelleri]
MIIVKTKPTSPGRRHLVKIIKQGLYNGRPNELLIERQTSSGGRNNNGRITTRHMGGRHRRHYRLIDFKRNKYNVPAIVERVEYDPNRSAHIAMLKYIDGERRYIIAPKNVYIGDKLESGNNSAIRNGNNLQLRNIPIGTIIHCIELKPGKGAQLIRSAGTSAQLIAHTDNYATVRLCSGEVRLILLECRATIGEIGHSEHNLRKLGKAGAKRWKGLRPTVRGVAMNPIDHPHGGGEGRTSGGRHPVTPWGVPTKGYKTRKNKCTDKLIIRRINIK